MLKLLFAPRAVSLRRDGTLLISLTDALVAVDRDQHMETLASSDHHDLTYWGNLNPNSSVLDSEEHKLYISMIQFVGEFDLQTKRFRYLIPNEKFLNKLSKEEEACI